MTSPRLRGYSTTWDKLSVRARRLQPFCGRCGRTDRLTGHHTEEAWQRHAAGQVIRLADVAVLCDGCNTAAGSTRPGGGCQAATPQDRRRWGRFVSHTEAES